MSRRTLVTFHAHPDDEAIATGGVMAQAAAAGHRVVLVLATKGELGEVGDGVLADGEALAERRTVEVAAAAEILGVERVAFLGYRDSGMADDPRRHDDGSFASADVDEAAGRLAAILREEHADVLTVYDPFTVVSLMQIEDMGFCPKGEAGAFVEGDTLHHDGGRLPFNTHGGLLSHAYVLGIAHVVEVVKQLRGTAAAQVPECEVGVYGGYTGHMASTLVLVKDR